MSCRVFKTFETLVNVMDPSPRWAIAKDIKSSGSPSHWKPLTSESASSSALARTTTARKAAALLFGEAGFECLELREQ